MTQPLYDIYFTGQLVEGIEQPTAIDNLARLFKSSTENVIRLFNGKPQLLKRGLGKEEALKYKAALHKAGLLVAFKAHQQQAAANPTPVTESPITADPVTATAASKAWSIAPAGSDVLKENERRKIQTRDIDTSSIKLVSAFMETPTVPQAAPVAPNTSHLSIAAAGEDLLIDKPDAPPPLSLNIDDISLAPAGSDLEQIPSNLPPINPDTSGITLAAPGVDILETKAPAAPPAPSTDHISLVNNN
ncbi:MAG: hypothetical protein WCY88_01900 [Spongiibacteraceae bacterium]|jgi:hypothetical protein